MYTVGEENRFSILQPTPLPQKSFIVLVELQQMTFGRIKYLKSG